MKSRDCGFGNDVSHEVEKPTIEELVEGEVYLAGTL
jgi:hypothetical protein